MSRLRTFEIASQETFFSRNYGSLQDQLMPSLAFLLHILHMALSTPEHDRRAKRSKVRKELGRFGNRRTRGARKISLLINNWKKLNSLEYLRFEVWLPIMYCLYKLFWPIPITQFSVKFAFSEGTMAINSIDLIGKRKSDKPPRHNPTHVCASPPGHPLIYTYPKARKKESPRISFHPASGAWLPHFDQNSTMQL